MNYLLIVFFSFTLIFTLSFFINRHMFRKYNALLYLYKNHFDPCTATVISQRTEKRKHIFKVSLPDGSESEISVNSLMKAAGEYKDGASVPVLVPRALPDNFAELFPDNADVPSAESLEKIMRTGYSNLKSLEMIDLEFRTNMGSSGFLAIACLICSGIMLALNFLMNSGII